jgi:hypothetical protein
LLERLHMPLKPKTTLKFSLNKQSQTADKRWSSNLNVGQRSKTLKSDVSLNVLRTAPRNEGCVVNTMANFLIHWHSSNLLTSWTTGSFSSSTLLTVFCFPWRCGGSSTHVWMPTYVSILRVPQVIWVCRATVEWYWQGKTEELRENPVPVPLCPPQVPDWPRREPGPPRWEAGD